MEAGEQVKRFLLDGNICGDRVRIGRALQKPPMKQEDLAREINFLGMDMTPLIISRIEQGKRHVCDGELVMLAKALHVSLDWLCGLTDQIDHAAIQQRRT